MNRCGRGFTLLELLASVTVLAFLMACVAGISSGILGGSIRVGEAIGEDSMAGEIEEVIADDLAFVTVPVTDKAVQVARDGTDSQFVFYSACGPKTAWGYAPVTIHRITYRVKTLPGGSKGLFRGEEPLVKTKGALYDAPLLLAEGVTDFSVEAFDGEEWSAKWPAGRGGILPVLLRVRLGLAFPGGRQMELLIEAAPPVEVAVKPEAERRASGGGDSEAQRAQDKQQREREGGEGGGSEGENQ